MHPKQFYNEKEGAILSTLYDQRNGVYDSYSLTRKLNPAIPIGDPREIEAFTEARDTTEELILKDLVDGERLSGVNGIYFKELELTKKGQRAAIQYRKQKVAFEKELPELVKEAQRVDEEMRSFQNSDKPDEEG